MKEIVFAGFGGQGVLTGGLVIAYIAAAKELNPVWMPSYGPTMRGGKANCTVKFGDDPTETVGSPAMDEAEILIAMSEPALDYIEFCKPDATLFVNAHAVREDYPYPSSMTVLRIECVDLANSVQNPKGANLIMAAAAIKHCRLFDEKFALDTMCHFFESKGKGKYNDANIRAFKAGYESV